MPTTKTAASMNESQSLSPKQYAQRHGVSTRTVFRWMHNGRIKHDDIERLSARTIRITTGHELPEPSRPFVPSRSMGVYFIRGAELIKIGRGGCVRNRLHNMRVASPVRLDPAGFILTATIAESVELEIQLHQRFQSDRSHGEWFRESPELRAYIEANAKPWPA